MKSNVEIEKVCIIKPMGSQPAQLYELVKIHKNAYFYASYITGAKCIVFFMYYKIFQKVTKNYL